MYKLALVALLTLPVFAQDAPDEQYTVTTNIDGTPAEVNIGGVIWKINRVKALNGVAIADTDCVSHTIRYIRDDNPTSLRDTIAHELFHAGACGHGGATYWNSKSDGMNDHIGIERLGGFESNLLLSNPAYAWWASHVK